MDLGDVAGRARGGEQQASPAALLARLADVARRSGTPTAAVLERYARERLVDRISRSRHAQAFEVDGLGLRVYPALLGAAARGPGPPVGAALAAALRAAARTRARPEDHVSFDAASVRVRPAPPHGARLFPDRAHPAERVSLVASVAGRAVPLRVELAVEGGEPPPRDEVAYPSLLEGPAPRLRGRGLEARAAALLVDLAVLASSTAMLVALAELSAITWRFELSGAALVAALREAAETHHPALPASGALHVPLRWIGDHPPARWRWRRLGAAAGLGRPPPPLSVALARLAAFGEAPLAAAARGAAFGASWPAGGPWRRRDGARVRDPR